MKTKKQISNRIFSLVLSIMMVVCMLPMNMLTASAAEVTTYQLWVGGEQLASDKLTINGTTGTATYAPATNTLTLDNFTYSENGDDFAAVTYFGEAALNIVLKGNSSITGPTNVVSSYGLFSVGSVRFSGDGGLTATGGKAINQSYGLYISNGDITVNSGSVSGIGGETTDFGGSYGVYTGSGSITVESGSLTGIGGAVVTDNSQSMGVRTSGDIKVLGGSLSGIGGDTTGSCESCGIYAYSSICIYGGNATATSGTGTNGSYGVWANVATTISGGIVEAQGERRAFFSAPSYVENLEAVLWYGDSTAAKVGEGKTLDTVDEYYRNKYVCIEVVKGAPVPDPNPAPVASVTFSNGSENNYDDITIAIEVARANAGSMLTLLDNITTDATTYIDSGSFTIDLNGKTWESNGSLTIRNNSDIKITNNSGEGKLLGNGNGHPTIRLYDTSKLEIAGGTVENRGLSQVIDMSSSGRTTNAQLIISGGKVATNSRIAISAFGSSITVTGGTIESTFYNIAYKTGVIDLSGHSDPTGIKILNQTGVEVIPGENTIKLPDGYAMLDSDGNAVTTLAVNTIYTVGVPDPVNITFDTNGGMAIDPITVTYGEKYGTLPSSAVTGLSGGNKNWYLVDEYGKVTDINIKNLSLVETARDHTLFMKRSVLAPAVKITLEVHGAISNDYQYYVPENSTRILTATLTNRMMTCWTIPTGGTRTARPLTVQPKRF